jgi:BASS family bile acid:Na+ symporter
MFVVACCPGGAASNLMTYLARGDVAYSVALTAASSMLAAMLTPALILLWSNAYPPTAALLHSIDVSPWVFVGQTVLLLGTPLVAGMIIAARAPDVAMRIRRRMAVLGVLALGAVIVYGVISFYPLLLPALPLLGAIAVVHNAAAFATGLLAGFLLNAGPGVRRALTIEVGIQNSGLAIVILLAQLKGLGGAAAIAVTWGIWHLIAGALIVLLFRGIDRTRGSA